MLETIDSGAVTAIVLTSGLGWLLVQLGLRARLLDARRPRRRCPSCARLLEEDLPCRCRN